MEPVQNENVHWEFICRMIRHKSQHLYIWMHLIYTQGRHWQCHKILQKKRALNGLRVVWNLEENCPKFSTWNANSLQKYATYFSSHIKYAKIWLQIESKAKHRCTINFILVPLWGAKAWEDFCIFIFYIQFIHLFLLWMRDPLKY